MTAADLPFSYRNHLRYIAIEGVDGSGKSTQTKRLVDTLNDQLKREVRWPRTGEMPDTLGACQPTRGPIGALIREMLRGKGPVDDAALQLLFAADRMSASSGLKESLEHGHHIISDRCELSSAVYYAAATPQFKCEVCGWIGDTWEAQERKFAKRWTYDDHRRQQKVIEVQGWRHNDACDLDLTDVGERRFNRALSWNDDAVHPGLIIVLESNAKITNERLIARGNVLDLFETDLVQARAARIYDWATKYRSLLRLNTKIRGVPGWGTEDAVAGRVLSSVWKHIEDCEEDDRA